MRRSHREFAVAAAVNDRGILASCLARSPDIVSGDLTLKTYEGYTEAALALNAGLDESGDAAIVIFAHQDVYFPRGWLQRLIDQIELIEQTTPNWGVIGLSGLRVTGEEVGHVWSSGLGHICGEPGFAPAEAETLDELTLIVRKASGLRFDDKLPGFHFYGTDIVKQGMVAGIPSFVVDAPAVHNSRPTRTLTGAYARAYRYMQRKWRGRLPIRNLSSKIVWHPLRLWRAQLQIWKIYRRNIQRPPRDAVEIARSLNFE